LKIKKLNNKKIIFGNLTLPGDSALSPDRARLPKIRLIENNYYFNYYFKRLSLSGKKYLTIEF